jgi:hypothetical protein
VSVLALHETSMREPPIGMALMFVGFVGASVSPVDPCRLPLNCA